MSKDSDFFFQHILKDKEEVHRQFIQHSHATYFTQVEGETFSVTMDANGLSAKYAHKPLGFTPDHLRLLFNLMSQKAFCPELMQCLTTDQIVDLYCNPPQAPMLAITTL